MLKAQLHIHCKDDPQDKLKYSAEEVIDKAAELDFNVLSFTLHNKLFYPKEIVEYAKKKDILLIPGIELNIEGKDVLIYGLEKIPEIKKIPDLKKIKNKALIIAPHPYLPRYYALRNKLVENIDLFDGLEYAFFYTKFLNHNKKTKKLAEKFKKTLVGMGDIHRLHWFDSTYSLIDSKKNMKDVFEAIKNNKVEVITKPLSVVRFIFILIELVFFT